MSNLRATYDQKVIDAWAARVARRKHGIGKTQLSLLLALILCGVWMLLALSPVPTLLFFGVALALVVIQLVDRVTLLCPHCHRPPISTFQRGTSESADFCAHCYYWLKSPYGSARDKVG